MLGHDGAQALLDGLSSVSLGAAAFVVARLGTASLLRSRLRFTFASLCLFFAARAASHATGSPVLDLAQRLAACVLPLAALLLVEGMLRRHAPRALKAFVTLGGLAVATIVSVRGGMATVSVVALQAFVILSLAAVTTLLIARDRASLSGQENAGLDALAVPGVLVAVLSVTDFLAGAPVGLSGVGVAMVAFVLGANPSSPRQARGVLSQLLVIAAVAAASAVAFAAVLEVRAAGELVRLGALLLSLLLATAAVLRAREAGDGHDVRGFARALAAADTSDLERFLGDLAAQPLLAGMRVAEGAQLAEYDRPALAAALATRVVWNRAMVRDPDEAAVRPREELADLMTRTEATHAVLLSSDPPRIALLTLPGGGRADAAETDLALFGKLAAIAAKE